MKKMLLVFGFLALAGIAANAATVTTYNFTFDGYCDGMTLHLYKPTGLPKAIFGGTHNFYDCSNSVYVGGFKHGLNAGFQYAATGPVLDVSDPQVPYFAGPFSSQYLVNTKYHTWVLYEGVDGVGNYVVNYGTFTNAAQVKLKGTGAKASAQR